jgi:hypothetical protein
MENHLDEHQQSKGIINTTPCDHTIQSAHVISDPSLGHSHAQMAAESNPNDWSEENPPSPSDLLQYLQQICRSPTNGDSESGGAVFANESHGISDTPSPHPNPSLTDLGMLSVAINYYRCFTSGHLPLQKSLSSASYTLSIQPVYPESLNTTPPGSQEFSTFHYQL